MRERREKDGCSFVSIGNTGVLASLFMGGGLGIGALLGLIGVILGAVARKKAAPDQEGSQRLVLFVLLSG